MSVLIAQYPINSGNLNGLPVSIHLLEIEEVETLYKPAAPSHWIEHVIPLLGEALGKV